MALKRYPVCSTLFAPRRQVRKGETVAMFWSAWFTSTLSCTVSRARSRETLVKLSLASRMKNSSQSLSAPFSEAAWFSSSSRVLRA